MEDASKELFGPTVVRAALIGALLGTIGTVGVIVAAVVASGTDTTVIGIAGLAGPFAGAGFGAMLGAVLGGIKVHEEEQEANRAVLRARADAAGQQ